VYANRVIEPQSLKNSAAEEIHHYFIITQFKTYCLKDQHTAKYIQVFQFTEEQDIHSVTTVRRVSICQFRILMETNIHCMLGW
jgi:hypothetical protein